MSCRHSKGKEGEGRQDPDADITEIVDCNSPKDWVDITEIVLDSPSFR
jgi:hypothetical protein